jgi:hypothetical protein
MNKTIFNPFKYVAGAKSLILGILIILITAYIGFLSHTHFPDLIAIKSCSDFPVWYFVLQSLSNWLVFSIILYLCAIVVSTSSIRVIDIFGTQALARFPYLIASFIGFSDSMNKFVKYILWSSLKIGVPNSLSTSSAVIAVSLMILTVLLMIWLIVLMYNAFKVSANLKGTKSIVLFIIVFIVSIILTGYITKYLITNFS